MDQTILAPFSLSLSLFHQWLLLGSTPFLLGFSLFIWLAIAKSLVVGLNCNRISNHGYFCSIVSMHLQGC
ncbi:hypothetical protein AAZX31_08G289600 [Glycine max]